MRWQLAEHGHGFEVTSRASHDGVLRCALCASDDSDASYDWCQAAECITCDGCCVSLQSGDVDPLISIISTTGRVVPPDVAARACATCQRGTRALIDRAMHEEAGPTH